MFLGEEVNQYLVCNMCTRMKAALTILLYTMQLVSNSVQKMFNLEIDLSQQSFF
jgi:hypothetical protein